MDRKVDRDELSSDNPAHRDIFRSLERRLVKLTFQPKLHFPEIGRRFQPRVSAKIRVLAKIVRSQFVACKGKEVVQHGVRFVYDEQDDEGMDCWREIKKGHGNRHFNEIHTTLGRLSGFLERESRDKGLLGVTQEISGNRGTLREISAGSCFQALQPLPSRGYVRPRWRECASQLLASPGLERSGLSSAEHHI